MQRALLLLLALVLVPFATAQQAPQDLKSMDLDELLRVVKAEEDKVAPQVLARIASFQTEDAFKTLKRAVGCLRTENRLNSAYGGFVRFRDRPDLRQQSIDFLHDEARSHQRDENQRAAARGLTLFGEPAFEALEQLLARHREESVRRIAAQPLIPRLGQIGSRKAAETILELGELRTGPQEQVLFDALLACDGSKVDSLYTSLLLDEKTDERWRSLLLSVLAKRDGKGVLKGLTEALGDASPQIRTRVLEILGERKERGSLKKVRRHLSADDEAELRQAIVTMGQLAGGDEDWEGELFELAEDKRVAARMGAASALLELRTQAAVDTLHRLLSDADWRVRVEALQQVANLRRKPSVPKLIARLDQENGRLKRDVAIVLRLLTGLDHGITGARWKAWWSAEGSAFELPELKLALDAERERAERRRDNSTTATFYGLEVVSDRVAFVVDTSGSMSAKAGSKGRSQTGDTDSGPDRLMVAKQELSGALKGISPGVLFNIVFFSSGVAPWQDELVAKDERTFEEAVEYAARQKPAGGTNIYDALLVAMEDRRVDTIYLLSDGDPSAGQVTQPDLILERIGKLNRVRKIQIHCISIGKRSDFMRQLAEQNGGAYKESL